MDANVALMSIQDKIPSESLLLVKEKIEKASDDKIANLSIIPFKNSILGLILGLFFGMWGVDRFYKGDITLGIAKIATLVIGFITSFIYIGVFILFILWIWVIVDLFLVWKGIKRDNLNKVLVALS